MIDFITVVVVSFDFFSLTGGENVAELADAPLEFWVQRNDFSAILQQFRDAAQHKTLDGISCPHRLHVGKL